MSSLADAMPYFELAPADRALAVLATDAPYLPQLELDFDGQLDGERLERAVALLARRHPILGATVDPEAWRATWRPGMTAPQFLEMIDDGSTGPSSARARIAALLLDVRVGPISRAVLVHAGTRSRLVLGIHHAVADGRALVIMLDDLRLMYRELACDDRPCVDVDWSPRTAGALLDAVGTSRPARLALAREAARRWTSLTPSDHCRPRGIAEEDGGGLVDATVSFDTRLLDVVCRTGTGPGWRRSGVLLTLLERAWVAGAGASSRRPSRSNWMVAVDSRRAFGTTRGLGNLSGLEPVSLIDIDRHDRTALAAAASNAIESVRQPGGGIIAELAGSWVSPDAGPLLNSGIRALYASEARRLGLNRISSHLDRIPHTLAEWGDASAVGIRWMPDPRIVSPNVAMMWTTFLGTTSLTVVAASATCTPDFAAALVEHVRSDLEEWAADAPADAGLRGTARVTASRRVAILGGGIAGLAAAWELSRPGRRETIETITVYQRGWRLGGKGASSRGVHGRIEEHGLHVWLGYYENAFRLVRECYAELDRPLRLPDAPITTWDEAFRPASTIGLGELHEGEWLHWLAEFDEHGACPGDGADDRDPLTPAELVQRSLRLLWNFGESLRTRAPAAAPCPPLVLSAEPSPPVPPSRPGGIVGVAADAALVAALGALSTASSFIGALRRPASGETELLLDAVEVVVARVRADLAERARRDDAVRRSWQFVDLVSAIVRGLVADHLLDRPEGYAAVDDVDYRDWLVRHGAGPETIDSPLVRVVYDLVFGYEDGDASRPRFSAGTGLLLSGKMFFDYRGAIFWKMTAGMGEVVFAPLYEALVARGVRFRFFHRVDALRIDEWGTRIGAVDLGVQVQLRGSDDSYHPLVDVGGLPCWPPSPRLELLHTDTPGALDTLESLWSSALDIGSVTLRDGEDYDELVLAIPVGMHPIICRDLIANPQSPQWRAMTDALASVATQSMQLWLTVDEAHLGWSAPDVTTSGYPGAFHTYAAMSHLIGAEGWSDGERPASLAYFCHVLPTGATPPHGDVTYPVRELARVRSDAIRYLEEDVAHLWPRSQGPDGFRWELLAGGSSEGEARLDDQYLRANVDPSDRYVLSLPGTGEFRLRADTSGYRNLWLAGDWTDNGLNAGCIEAAVVSGIQAANALCRSPLLERVAGHYPTHTRFADPPSPSKSVRP